MNCLQPSDACSGFQGYHFSLDIISISRTAPLDFEAITVIVLQRLSIV